MESALQPTSGITGNSTHRHLVLYLILAMLVTVGVFVGLDNVYWHKLSKYFGGGEKLYLSLAPLGSTVTKLYTYDLFWHKLSPIGESTVSATNSALSPDGRFLAFAGLDKDSKSQIYLLDMKTSEQRTLTGDSFLYKRVPRWSPDGKNIAFTAASDAKDAFNGSLDKWGGHNYDISTNRQITLVQGAYATWLTDTIGLILQKDGIYAFDQNKKTLGKIIAAEKGTARFNMKIAVSHDRKLLAWTVPDAGTIYVYSIDSLSPVTFRKINELRSHSFWVAFSPDSKSLAAQEVDWETLDTAPHPRIVSFDLSTGEKKTILDLSQYNQQAMFFSEWR